MSGIFGRHLGEVAEITAGPSGSLLERLDEGPDGIPVVSPADITNHHKIDVRKLRRVPNGDMRKLSRFSLGEGDVLVVRQGSLGRFALVESGHDVLLYNSSCLRIRVRRDYLIPEYLIAFLSYPPTFEALLSKALPGTVQSINSEAVGNLWISLPQLDQQRKISDLVSDIDSQIRIHEEIIKRFELLKPAVFRDLLEGV
ncbi:restriction endonuclease subunit S [Amycolatopsis sp. cmx-8-4]|uniref:restriction endonuclease subunit S n=1 Tax=Amycolatopsis sp. cmx-8-4 TaxID=2790947 RepID=UPI00397AE859